MHTKKLIFSLLVIFLFACNNQEEKLDILSDSLVTTIDTTAKKHKKPVEEQKTVIVDDTCAIFFLPSPKERKELIMFYGAYNQYQFNTIFSNFTNMYNRVKSTAPKYGIKVELSYAKTFIFPMEDDTLIYDLKTENQVMGYILSDGINTPLIRNGVQKNKTISNDFRNYFNLINFTLNY